MAICRRDILDIFRDHTTDILLLFPFPSPCKRDGQFTDALKISVVKRTVRQAHRNEDPVSIGTDQRIHDGLRPPFVRML